VKNHGSQFRESDRTRQLGNTKHLAANEVRWWFRIILQFVTDYAWLSQHCQIVSSVFIIQCVHVTRGCSLHGNRPQFERD